MKKVCILKRIENTEEENEYYKNAIKNFGGVPLFIDEDNLNQLEDCQGIVLTGGFHKVNLDDYLIGYAISHNLPLLGICQGMQSMALYRTQESLEPVENHHQNEGYQHEVELKESNLSRMLGQNKIMVNSYHYEQVKSSKEFEIVGTSRDGVIEAIENPNHRFQIGVQWHPERMISYDTSSIKLFKEFINSLSND